MLQVVPVTGLPERELRPYEALISIGASGLERDSRAVANQLRTVARGRIHAHRGQLRPDELQALERAVEIKLGLRREP